jgi:8-oxo-dGTP diphosphatase
MIETTLCYIEQNTQYLMLHRTKKKKDPNSGKWVGVGGKIEKGESVEECLLREVREETGLELIKYQYRAKIYFYSDIYYNEIMHLYTASEFTGDLIECEEGELVWIDKFKVLELNLWQGDKIFIQRLLEDDNKPFILHLYYEGDKLVKVDEEAL